jgi:hypothetical protein
VVAFDGGFLSPPCNPFWVSDTPFAQPMATLFMVPGQFITTVQDRFLTTTAIWADGGTRVFAPLPSLLAVAVPLSPSAVATWNQNSVITYAEQPDGGWSVLANRSLAPFPAPLSGAALMGFPVSADQVYGAFDRMGRLALVRLDRLRDPAPVPANEVTPFAPWGRPMSRSLATVAALSGEAFLVAAGQTVGQPVSDVWRLTTTPRPAVTWRLPLDALPVDPSVLRTARVQARFEGPARAELRAWDPWRSQWVQAGRATADSGFVSGPVTVFNATLDVAVDLPPTTEPLLLDRLQASFDYVQP